MMAPWWSPFGQVSEIAAGELHEQLTHGAKIQLLDVRTRREFAHGHIIGAVNVPIQSFRRELPLLDLDGSKPVVTICKTAHRSPAATRVLRAHGFEAVQLAKGMDEWRRKKLPVQPSAIPGTALQGGAVPEGNGPASTEAGRSPGGGAALSDSHLRRTATDTGPRPPAVGAARAHGARKALLVAGVTLGMAALMAWALRVFGARSAWFALVIVWLPLAWFALLGRILVLRRPVLRLPARVHALRAVERDGRVYELLGVRVAKRLLRRGPLAVGAPDLHLPAEKTPANLAVLDERMQQAEAIHEILLVVTLAVAVNAAVRGWWDAAGWAVLFNIVFNGYPAMLQRYNRALLARRFGLPLPLRQPQRRAGRSGRTQDPHRHRPSHA